MHKVVRNTPSFECFRIAPAISLAGPIARTGVPKPLSNSRTNHLKSWMCLASSSAKRSSANLVVVAVDDRAGVVDDRRRDVLLRQPEDVQVAEPADLVELQLLLLAQTLDVPDARQGLGKEGLLEIEGASGDDVLDLPVDALRRIEDRSVIVIVLQHVCLLAWFGLLLAGRGDAGAPRM